MAKTKQQAKPDKPMATSPPKAPDLDPEPESKEAPAPAPEPVETGPSEVAYRDTTLDVEPEPEVEPKPEEVPLIENLLLIEVVAPTLNRPKEAQRLEVALEGVEVPEGCDLHVTIQRESEPRALTGIVNELVARSDAEIVVVLADHIVPDKHFLVHVVDAFHDFFPDLDGMVGLKIANMDPLPGVREYCFFAVGREFIKRFPGKQIFCPDYYHFYADTELGRFASEADVFRFAEKAEVDTFQVNNGRADIDSTWRASRSRKAEDDATNARRREAGLLWGRTFERVVP